MEFPYLFSPITINGMELKNRIVMTAMHLGYTPNGEVRDRLVDFYARRGEGGAGLVVVGGCAVDEYGSMLSMIGLNEDRFIPGLRRLTTAVKRHGTKIGAQLYQAGRYAHTSRDRHADIPTRARRAHTHVKRAERGTEHVRTSLPPDRRARLGYGAGTGRLFRDGRRRRPARRRARPPG